MAATFVVEDGTGKSDANSYCTLAFADQYIEDHLPDFWATWDALSDALQQQHLRGGTDYLDRMYGARYAGERANEDQALAFPQEGIEDLDGYAVDGDAVPVALQRATVEAAARVQAGTDVLPDETSPSDTKSETIKLGPLTISETFTSEGQGDTPHFQVIDRILQRAGLILPPGRVERA